MNTPETIHVEWEPIIDSDSERAVRDVFKLVLREMHRKSVDNPVDGKDAVRY